MRTRLFVAALIALAACTGGGDDDDDSGSPTPTPGPGTWEELAALPAAIQEIAVVSLGSEVFVLGGFDGAGTIVRSVRAWSSTAGTWRSVADLPVPMHHANAAVANGKIWVVGFLTGNGFTEDGRVFEYDPAANTWTERPPMPNGTERGAAAVATIGSTIYIAGGLRSLDSVADFWSLDLSTGTAGTWTMLPDLPAPRDHLGAGAIGGRFYAVGGRAGGIGGHTPRLDVFDPQSGTWSAGPAMPTSRGGFAAAVLGSSLYVFGGEGNTEVASGVFPDAERFDPATNAWEVLAPMRTPRHGMGAAPVAGKIVVPGGADVQAFGAVDVVEAYLP